MTTSMHADAAVPLTVAVTAIDGHAALRLFGEVDIATAKAFRAYLDALIATSDGDVVVDFSELAFIDSSGIAQLVGASKGLPGDRQLLLQHPSASLRKALAVTGVARLPNVAIREAEPRAS